MELDLCTITWEAIGSIITFISLIFALCSIIESNKQNKKNRDLEIALMKRDIEQKRLDEFVNNLLDMEYSMQSIDVIDLSMIFVNGMFTAEHRKKLENDASLDRYLDNRLHVQLTKFNKYTSEKEVLERLKELRNNYGDWVRTLSLLNLYEHTSPMPEEDIQVLINQMIDKIRLYNIDIDSIIRKDIFYMASDNMTKAKDVLKAYGPIMSNIIDQQKINFEVKLFEFAEREQKRIDAIVKN